MKDDKNRTLFAKGTYRNRARDIIGQNSGQRSAISDQQGTSFLTETESRLLRAVLLILVVLPIILEALSPCIAWSQNFGKNKITGQRFDWHIHRTEHFDIHYYPSEAKLVPIMAAIAEEAYEQHSEDFEHELRDRTPLILYKSHKDFQETNIILQELHEGIGGFCRTL